jgi:hypothetical protein
MQEAWAHTAEVLRQGEARAKEMNNQEERVRYMAEEMRRAGGQLYERAEEDQYRRAENFEAVKRQLLMESEQHKETVGIEARAHVERARAEAKELVRAELVEAQKAWLQEKERAESRYNAEVRERNELKAALERETASRNAQFTKTKRATEDLDLLETQVEVERSATRHHEVEALKMRK